MAGLYDKYKETGSVKQPKMHDGLKFGDKGFFDTHFPSGSPRDGKNPKMMGKLGNAGTKNNPLNFKDLDIQNAKAMDYNQSKPPMLFHDKLEKVKNAAKNIALNVVTGGIHGAVRSVKNLISKNDDSETTGFSRKIEPIKKQNIPEGKGVNVRGDIYDLKKSAKILTPVRVAFEDAQSERVGLKSGSKILKNLRDKNKKFPRKPTE
jgi:hypothetical protein